MTPPYLTPVRRTASVLFALALAITVLAAPAQANRLGPPWMSRVTADQTTLYGSQDRASPIGPLPKGAVVVVIGEKSDMTETPEGWIASSDLAELTDPWTAEVSADSIKLFSKP